MDMKTILRALDALKEAEQISTLSTPQELGRMTARALMARLEIEVAISHMSVPVDKHA